MNFLKKDKLIEKLEELKEEGFDIVHLPGGSSWDNSFCSSVIVPVYNKDTKEMYFVGVPYDSHYTDSNGNNKKANETPEETALRELQEECGIYGYQADLVYLPKSSYDVPDNTDADKRHYKHYFLLKNFQGSLIEFEGHNRIDYGIAAPLLFPASFFKEVLFKKQYPPLKEAVEILMAESPEYCYALMNI